MAKRQRIVVHRIGRYYKITKGETILHECTTPDGQGVYGKTWEAILDVAEREARRLGYKSFDMVEESGQ